MAKLKGMPIPQKAPSLKGLLYVSTWRGVAYMASWPKKRTRPLPEIVQKQNEWFRQANVLTKYIAPQLQITAREAVVGTPLYPRDVQVALMAGTLFSIHLDDGTILYSMATRNAVSESLDVLSKTQGGILYRNEDQWDVLPAAVLGQVLTTQGPNANPKWSTGGGGGGGAWALVETVAVDSFGVISANGLVLTDFRALQLVVDSLILTGDDLTIGIQLEIDSTWITAAYRFGAFAVSSVNSDTRIGKSAQASAVFTMDNVTWRPQNQYDSVISSTINLSNPNTGQVKGFTFLTTYHVSSDITVGVQGNAETLETGEITGIRIALSTGTLTGGTMTILGME